MEIKAYERALVFAARNGNEASFEELYKLYYQKIFALARMTVKNEADAEDILQQTFISAWQNIGKLADVEAFNTWLQRICLNYCYSLLRKRRSEFSAFEETMTDDQESEDAELASDMMLPDVYAEKADLKERLGRIIDELSDVQRQTLTLYYFSGLSVEEISRVMEVSEGTVKSRLFLARKAIRTEIEEQERKSGQKFYGFGLPLIPFAVLFTQKVEAASLSADTASHLFEAITEAVTGKALASGAASGTSAVSAAPDNAPASSMTSSPAKMNVTPDGVRAATKVTTDKVSYVASKGAAKTAIKTSAKHIGKGLLSRVAAAVLAVSMIAGGTVGAVTQASAVESFSVPEIPGAGTPDTDPVDRDENKQLNLAYETYLDLLIEEQEEIDSYEWQKGFASNDAAPDDKSHTRAVALSDITGDDIPELIYMAVKVNEYGYVESAMLNMVTAQNGNLITLHTSDGWDIRAGGGQHYYLFKQHGEDNLYAYTSSGDDYWTYSYQCFTGQSDGTLAQDEVCRHDISYDYESGEERIVENVYIVDGDEVTEDAYLSTVKQIENATSEILMYSYDPEGSFVDGYVAENGCSAMTCEEAIQYLRGCIGNDTGQAETTRETIDVAALPSSLNAFLKQFNDWYWDATGTWESGFANEYDCTHAADGTSNILAGIVNHVTPSCVDFSLYPGVMPEEHFESDPRGWSEYGWYVVYDGPTVDWVAKNIFNITDEEISALLTQGENQRLLYRENTSNGSYQYYAPIAGGIGDPMTEVRLKSAEFDGQKYYVTYDVYFAGVPNADPPIDAAYRGSYYAELGEKAIDGQTYWSMYKNAPESSNPADQPAAGTPATGTPAPEIFSEIPPRYWLGGDVGLWYSELIINSDGTFTGHYQDTNAGEFGDSYSGTVYYSDYTGAFTNPMKLDDHTYSFEVGPIVFSGTDGEAEIRMSEGEEFVTSDGVAPIRYVFTDRATLVEGETVYLYTPGAKLSELPDGFKHYVQYSDSFSDDGKTLSIFGLYDAEYKYGYAGTFESFKPYTRTLKFDDRRDAELSWGWELFDRDSSEYSHDLAMAGCFLSQAAESGQSEIESRLTSLGFEHIESKWYDFFDGGQNNPGISFASRLVTMNGRTVVIICITVRGSADIADWGTNFNSPFNGFSPAADNVTAEFKAYYNSLAKYYSIDMSSDNTILFITGHSQGGAVAGQLAQMLEGSCGRRETIFDYTFASPNYKTVGDADAYTNVHNIINVNDAVPKVPLGYRRYGHDWYYDLRDLYSDEKVQANGLEDFKAKHSPNNVVDEHALSSYLLCLVADTPANMGEGAVNRYSYSSVHCPVDIRVCALDGTLMAWTEGENVFYGEDPKALVLTDGDEKYIVASGEVEYTIIFEGTGEGTMNYEQQTLDGFTNEILSETAYSDVPVRDEVSYAVSVSESDAKESVLYEINGSGKAINRISESGKPSRVIFKSGLLGWLSVASAGIGFIILLIDSISIIGWIRRKRRMEAMN